MNNYGEYLKSKRKSGPCLGRDERNWEESYGGN